MGRENLFVVQHCGQHLHYPTLCMIKVFFIQCVVCLWSVLPHTVCDHSVVQYLCSLFVLSNTMCDYCVIQHYVWSMFALGMIIICIKQYFV